MEAFGNLIGRVFDDRYEVLRKLGSGGMAEVYLAHDRLLGRDVALKVLLGRYAADDQFVERFRREASSAAGLSHPNIVQIYDRGEAEHTYYIAMEYLEGRSLKEIILKYAPLSPDLLISVSAQILEALRFAHRRDIIHRDIKPQNIIVDKEGRVKVTDFGIARAGSASAMTEAGFVLGTAQYFSPEQAQGKPVEAASDLYSLGVVMYEMATGRLPFTGDNPVSIAMKQIHEAPVPPRSFVPDLPESLEAVILRAMAKDPAGRYLTADAFLEDLGKAQKGETVAPPPEYLEEATRVMTPGGLPMATEPTQVRPPVAGGGRVGLPITSETRRGRSPWPWILLVLFIVILGGTLYIMLSSFLGEGDLAEVPGLLGMSQQEAADKATSAGFELEVAGNEPSATYAKGEVALQEPGEGDKADRNSTIRVWLSSGAETVEVPDLVGQNQVAAAQLLGEKGLKIDPREEPTKDKPEGTILRQDPAPGEEVSVGSTITVWVAVPSDLVAVPDLRNMEQARAIAMLTEFKLKYEIEQVDSELPGGTVVDQSPAPNTEVKVDSIVVLYVSNAPVIKYTTVPDVVGMTVAQATARLGQADLVIKVVTQDNPAAEPGKVYNQNPQEGVEVPVNSVVQVFVSQLVTTTTTVPSTTTTTVPSTTTTSPPTS